MAHDPFRPPATDVDAPDVQRGPAVKAIVLGALTDIGGSMLSGIIFSLLYGIYLGATGNSIEDMGKPLSMADANNSPIGFLMNMVGCLFSVLGGYVCARIAKHSEYRLGVILAVVTVSLGFLMMAGGEPDPLAGIYSLLTVAAVMVGSHLGAKTNQRERAQRKLPAHT